MDTKQKTLLVVTVAAFGYLGYQVYALVKQDVSPRPVVSQTSRADQAHLAAGNAAAPIRTANAATARQMSSTAVLPIRKNIPQPTTLQRQSLVTGQKAYLRMVNEYELAKMKRRLLEEQAAIATAQHRIATLNKKTRDIDDSLVNSPSQYNDTMTGTMNSPRRALPYQLSYVDNQHGQWTATLSKAGRYHEVSVGSQLPDGIQIVNINRQGVTLKEGEHSELLTFDGIVPQTAVPQPQNAGVNAIGGTRITEGARIRGARVSKLACEEPTCKKPQVNANTITSKNANASERDQKRARQQARKGERKRAKQKQPHNKNSITSHQTTILHGTPTEKTRLKKKHDITVASTPKKKPITQADNTTEENTTTTLKELVFASIAPDSTNDPITIPTLQDPPQTSQKTTPTKHDPVTASTPQAPPHNAQKVQKAQTIIAVESQDKTTDAPLNTTARYTGDERRLLRMPANHYTIQLIGSYHRDIVENFAIANDLGNRVIQLHVNNRGKRWYMLFYGNYATLVQAKQSLHRLPPNLTPEDPWIRQVSDMQQNVRGSEDRRQKTA